MSRAYMKKIKTRNKIFDLKKSLADVKSRIAGMEGTWSEYPTTIDHLLARRDWLVLEIRALGGTV